MTENVSNSKKRIPGTPPLGIHSPATGSGGEEELALGSGPQGQMVKPTNADPKLAPEKLAEIKRQLLEPPGQIPKSFKDDTSVTCLAGGNLSDSSSKTTRLASPAIEGLGLAMSGSNLPTQEDPGVKELEQKYRQREKQKRLERFEQRFPSPSVREIQPRDTEGLTPRATRRGTGETSASEKGVAQELASQGVKGKPLHEYTEEEVQKLKETPSQREQDLFGKLEALADPTFTVVRGEGGRPFKEVEVDGKKYRPGPHVGKGAVKVVNDLIPLEGGKPAMVLATIDLGALVFSRQSPEQILDGLLNEVEIGTVLADKAPGANLVAIKSLTLLPPEQVKGRPKILVVMDKLGSPKEHYARTVPASPFLPKDEFLQTESTKLQATIDVLKGLRAIHAAGILHKDISWNNTLSTPSGQGRVIDFGQSCTIEKFKDKPWETVLTTVYADPAEVVLKTIFREFQTEAEQQQIKELLKTGQFDEVKNKLHALGVDLADHWLDATRGPYLQAILEHPEKMEMWSVGIMLYEAMTNENLGYILNSHNDLGILDIPMLRNTVFSMEQEEVDPYIESPSTTHPDSPWNLCLQCLNLDPMKRPSLAEIVTKMEAAQQKGQLMRLPVEAALGVAQPYPFAGACDRSDYEAYQEYKSGWVKYVDSDPDQATQDAAGQFEAYLMCQVGWLEIMQDKTQPPDVVKQATAEFEKFEKATQQLVHPRVP